MEVAGYLNYLDGLVRQGGPNYSDYEQINSATVVLMDLSVEEQARLFEILRPILSINSMIGFTFFKPYGYAGDFELISRIYDTWKSPDPKFQKWDDLYHWSDTAKAIRSRKLYFKSLVDETYSKNSSPLILNLGSGPCIDIFEYFQKSPRSKAQFECVDMDAKSIEFGTAVCDNHIDSLSFINANVFSFKSHKEYDLIWSAGLFDYFNDKLFVTLLSKYFKLLKQGGELVIANFSETNPSRGLMEVFCRWGLHHRSEVELIDLSLAAGVSRQKIKIRSSQVDNNLYLHLRK